MSAVRKFFGTAIGQVIKSAAFLGAGAFVGSLAVDIIPFVSDPTIGAAVGGILGRFAEKLRDRATGREVEVTLADLEQA